eukprot:gnl/MRDRNA2_/MRDRNA2_88830_c0_seq1.p1 gnl/MRDRNA2_/MRDRNA2_88830_c0~~gnl/MRDRNA2_/MRDRNA2_88830_c0_seq1.p1  ORF type:complete len:233 (+),score=64.59 gnl/MRDRNA2_/MRDRNA2_88830_c0_seq1:103-699(+)
MAGDEVIEEQKTLGFNPNYPFNPDPVRRKPREAVIVHHPDAPQRTPLSQRIKERIEAVKSAVSHGDCCIQRLKDEAEAKGYNSGGRRKHPGSCGDKVLKATDRTDAVLEGLRDVLVELEELQKEHPVEEKKPEEPKKEEKKEEGQEGEAEKEEEKVPEDPAEATALLKKAAGIEKDLWYNIQKSWDLKSSIKREVSVH